MQCAAGVGGWFHCYHDDLVVDVQFLLAEDGRLVPQRVDVHANELPLVMTEARLRKVPLNAIEAAANGPEYRQDLLDRLGEPAEYTTREADGRSRVVSRRRRPTGKLPIPTGNRYPDSFYKRVASEYARLVASGVRSPAVVMAEVNNQPVTTVHRWIKEARRRGFLPAGRSGRAG